ncbi:hypothetical protein ACFLV4_04110 [Chloroflexota bacterium]
MDCRQRRHVNTPPSPDYTVYIVYTDFTVYTVYTHIHTWFREIRMRWTLKDRLREDQWYERALFENQIIIRIYKANPFVYIGDNDWWG